MKIFKGRKALTWIVLAVVLIITSITIVIVSNLHNTEETKEISRLQATELPNYNDIDITGDLGKIRVGESKSFDISFRYDIYHHTSGWSIGIEGSGDTYLTLTDNGFDGEHASYNFKALGHSAGNAVIAIWQSGTKVARYTLQVVEKASISFSKTTMTLAKGNYDTFTVTYKGRIVNSVVNDSSIAHISYRDYGSGFTVTVTADKAGSTPIVFTASDGVESVIAILNLTVNENGPRVTFNKETLTVAKGSSATFTVTYSGTIVSSFVDSNVATISYNTNTNPMTVTVTGKAAGTTQISITAIAANTSASDSLTLTVTDSGSGGSGGSGGGRRNHSSSYN